MVQDQCGCERNGNPKENSVLADRVFLYHSTDQISASEMKRVLDRTLRYYEEVGITFDDAKVIGGTKFPQLQGLDLLLFFVDYSPSPTPAQFSTSCVQWTLMNGQVNGGETPYDDDDDDDTIAKHTGFVAYDDCVNLYDRYLREGKPPFQSLPEQERIEYFASIATHELAHGLGALDVRVRRKFGEDLTNNDPRIAEHIMACPYLGVPKHFFTENVRSMKDFVRKVRAEDIDILALRDRLLMGEHGCGNAHYIE